MEERLYIDKDKIHIIQKRNDIHVGLKMCVISVLIMNDFFAFFLLAGAVKLNINRQMGCRSNTKKNRHGISLLNKNT